MISIADISKLISAMRASIEAFNGFAETLTMSDLDFTEVDNIWLELACTTNHGEKALSSFPLSLRNNAVVGITHNSPILLQQLSLIIRASQYHSYLGGHITNAIAGRTNAALAY